MRPTVATTSSLTSQYAKEIENFNRGEKFFARNRFVVDPSLEASEQWPVWPNNLFFTATPILACEPHESPTNILRDDSSDSGSDSLYAAYYQDEPQRKRLRSSPLTPSSPLSSYPGELSEHECDLLFDFCNFADDEQFMDSASSISSESSREECY
jgi:hypothetical protein